jgi:hypothetical protein
VLRCSVSESNYRHRSCWMHDVALGELRIDCDKLCAVAVSANASKRLEMASSDGLKRSCDEISCGALVLRRPVRIKW